MLIRRETGRKPKKDINPDYVNKLNDGEDYEESALTDVNPEYVDSVWYYKHNPWTGSQNWGRQYNFEQLYK